MSNNVRTRFSGHAAWAFSPHALRRVVYTFMTRCRIGLHKYYHCYWIACATATRNDGTFFVCFCYMPYIVTHASHTTIRNTISYSTLPNIGHNGRSNSYAIRVVADTIGQHNYNKVGTHARVHWNASDVRSIPIDADSDWCAFGAHGLVLFRAVYEHISIAFCWVVHCVRRLLRS